MPLVINGLGGGHTDRHTDTCIPTHEPKQFQETGTCGRRPCEPGLKMKQFSASLYVK